MMTEHIHKEVCNFTFDKYGQILKDNKSQYTIDIDVEINTTLNQMCKDLLALIKDDDVFVIHIVYPIPQYSYRIEARIFDLEYVKRIVFEEYYLQIDGVKIFYNAIFGFKKRRRW